MIYITQLIYINAGQENENISAFYRDAPDGGNAKLLKSIPVRLYCDPDINWYIENRRTPIEHTNLADLTACIVQLKLLGNMMLN
jgi:hypothetical protein